MEKRKTKAKVAEEKIPKRKTRKKKK